VTGAGGRFGAACDPGAAENAAAGTGPLAARLAVAGAGAVLNTAGAGRPEDDEAAGPVTETGW
jgi:hypothetical protein